MDPRLILVFIYFFKKKNYIREHTFFKPNYECGGRRAKFLKLTLTSKILIFFEMIFYKN